MEPEMEERANALRSMEICRFCLDNQGPFTNIYEKDTRDGKQTTPLPLQIMACVAIEVFQNDGMPQLICNNCRAQTIGAYNFKTTCKKSDDALKLYLATGTLVKPTKTKQMKIIRVPEQQKPPQQTKSSKRILEESHSPPNQATKKGRHDSIHEMEEEMYMGDSQNETGDDGTEEEYDEESISKVSQVKTDIFPCNQCERSFPLKQLLELHLKNHTRERSFECKSCGRKFFTKYDLAKHEQTHSSDKPYVCVICNRSFARESLLHRHERVHNDVPKYLCTLCDKTFLTREDLDLHSEKHKKVRPFTCRICNKGFVFKQGLERHEATHTEEKPHKCNYCEASFTSPIKLMRHITSHAGLRPYPCKICSRTFLLSHHLTRHMRSHYAKSQLVEPVGQHKCDVCSMSFRRKDSLINHSAIHSMVNLKCVICNTSFMNAKQVKDHITTHLAGLPYPCDKCDYSFDTQDQLTEHEIKHAEMEYEDQIEQEVSLEAEVEQMRNMEEDNEITEFTISNDSNDSPKIVKRATRSSTRLSNATASGGLNSTNYFLNSSDMDEEHIQEELKTEEIQYQEVEEEEESIKPIYRMEGMKVYKRKNATMDKQKTLTHIPKVEEDPNINLDAETTVCLSQQVVKDLPDKQYVDMKIGNKTVRVQKLIMTKAEIDMMAKQGKIEVKGDNIILRKQLKPVQTIPFKPVTIENILTEDKPAGVAKSVITRTYTKKTQSLEHAPEVTEIIEEVETDPNNSILEESIEVHEEEQEQEQVLVQEIEQEEAHEVVEALE